MQTISPSQIKKAKVELTEGWRNNMPGRKEVLKLLNDSEVVTVETVDTKDAFWQNAEDTLVIKISERTNPVALAMFCTEAQVDECHAKKVHNGDEIVVRLWWD